MIKNIYFTYCLIPIIIAKTEIVQHEVYIVANIVPDVRPGCLYSSAKAATIGHLPQRTRFPRLCELAAGALSLAADFITYLLEVCYAGA